MTDADHGTFDRAFRRVAGAFRLKLKEAEMDDLSRTYFRVLAAAPLDDVLAAGKACLSSCRAFPKPVEWLQALPLQPIRNTSNKRVMDIHERADYCHAEAKRYQDDPCGCASCQAAHVTHRPLRFVPNEVNGVLDEVKDMVRDRIVVTGHWAHGEELARWYAARDAFFASAPQHTRLARVLMVLVTREPGEEG